MDKQEHDGARETAVNSVAAYLHDEVGLEERAARDSATTIVRDARDTAAVKRLESPRSWWSLALRGVLALAVGIVFLVRPHASVVAAVFVIGAWIFVDGIVGLVSAFTQEDRSWKAAPIGAVGAVIGYLILSRSGSATIVLYILIAAWALARGASEIALVARMNKHEPGRGTLAFLGIASFAFGVVLLVAPVVGVVALGLWIGLYAIIYGGIEVIRSFQVRRVSGEVRQAWSGRPAQRPA